MTLCRSIT